MKQLVTTAILMNCAAALAIACGGTDSNTSVPSGNAGGNASVTTGVGGNSQPNGGNSSSTGGAANSGGAQNIGGTSSSTGSCGTVNQNPFGCKFAWGLQDPGGSLAGYSYLQFMTYWIETGIKADGTFTSCGGCNWIKNSIAPTNLIPVYYAYIIGFLGHANGYVDGNQCPASNPNCPSLNTNGADLIRSMRSQIIQAYADYAKQSYAVWPTKPLVWLLEGDFVEYAGSSETNPLTMTELGQLAADITCAIKGNMPNAVVAIDHSVWNSDQQTKDFFNSMKSVNYDMVWTTGVASNSGYITSGANASSYNAATAKYSVLHQLTGKTILVEDGCGAELNEDWKTATPSQLNGLIANGVIAFTHCGRLESTYQSSITALEPQLNSTCL
jgi:hypothetical protein